MKNRTSLLFRIRTCMKYILNRKNVNGIVASCNYCGSTNLRFDSEFKKANSYVCKYRCMNCGAYCSNKENWFENKAYEEEGGQ